MRLIPREIRRRYQNGYVTCEVTIEAETPIGLGIIGDTPAEPPEIPTTPPPVPVPTPIPIPVPSGNAKEVWFATADAIYWASDYFSGGQPTWTKIGSLPITPTWFGIAKNGTAAYISNATSIYMTPNPKVPAWTVIATAGTSAAGSTINTYFGYTLGPCTLQNTTLYTAAHVIVSANAWVYGEYNGSAWSWSRTTDVSAFAPSGVGKNTYVFNNPIRVGGTNALLETLARTFGYRLYRSTAGTRYGLYRSAGNVLNLHIVNGADTALGASTTDGSVNDSEIFGAETGNQVYVVSGATGAYGHLWLADDGSTFSDIATWSSGWVRDAIDTGGGSLVWALKSVASSNVPTRLYNRNGTVIRDMTGNFWSLTTGDQVLVGMGLVY